MGFPVTQVLKGDGNDQVRGKWTASKNGVAGSSVTWCSYTL